MTDAILPDDYRFRFHSRRDLAERVIAAELARREHLAYTIGIVARGSDSRLFSPAASSAPTPTAENRPLGTAGIIPSGLGGGTASELDVATKSEQSIDV